MKLNLCCGEDYREGYINVDFAPVYFGKDLKIDKTIDLLSEEDWVVKEFGENSADEIIFHEALEHFNRHNGLFVLERIYRLLKPGGKLSVTVPPAKQQLKMFLLQMDNVNHIDDFLYAHEKFTPIKYHDDVMGATCRSDGKDGDSHKTLYSKNMLRVVLEHVGLKIISIDDRIGAVCTK